MIGILTFYWADDFGAMLQSYALKTYLRQYQQTILIPYFPKELRSRYRLFQYARTDSVCRRLYKIARQLTSAIFFENLKTKRSMTDFRKKYLVKERKKLSSSAEIERFGRDITVFVVGSDQVWNPEITEGFQEGYFCTFRQHRERKARYIAYAASIGGERLEERYNGKLSELLANFDTISIRETLAKPYIDAIYGRKTEAVLDPVFLLGKREWESLLIQSGKRMKKATGFSGKLPAGKYIAVYDTEYHPEMSEYLKRLEKQTGYEVIVARPVKKTRRSYRWTVNEKYVTGGGPLDFLKILHDAAYVVTNSFHGTAFSIIFRKQFTVFPHSTRGARIQDILHASRLECRMAYKGDDVERIDDIIDWNDVEEALEEKIRFSKTFINEEILK